MTFGRASGLQVVWQATAEEPDVHSARRPLGGTERSMTMVTARLSVSLDGCYAGPRDTADHDDEAVELTPTRVVDTPGATHLRYRVAGRRRIELDQRGRDG